MKTYDSNGIPVDEVPWIAEARKWIGTAEIAGAKNSPVISSWLQRLHAWWTDDETPWCGTFVAQCLQTRGYAIPSAWYRAFAYASHGKALSLPAYGAVVVLRRSTGKGYHVAFIVGKDAQNRLMCLGGNQGDKVTIAPFSRDRVVTITWPSVSPHPSRFELPLLGSKTENTKEQ